MSRGIQPLEREDTWKGLTRGELDETFPFGEYMSSSCLYFREYREWETYLMRLVNGHVTKLRSGCNIIRRVDLAFIPSAEPGGIHLLTTEK